MHESVVLECCWGYLKAFPLLQISSSQIIKCNPDSKKYSTCFKSNCTRRVCVFVASVCPIKYCKVFQHILCLCLLGKPFYVKDGLYYPIQNSLSLVFLNPVINLFWRKVTNIVYLLPSGQNSTIYSKKT